MYNTSSMIRLQLHLTEEQDRKLRELSRERGRSRAELIREAIELLFRESALKSDALFDLIGSAGPAGRSDVSDKHDELLYAAEGQRPDWQRKSS
jgi:Arc/MetJ-type ribon-helix-helix transcriptional regulator